MGAQPVLLEDGQGHERVPGGGGLGGGVGLARARHLIPVVHQLSRQNQLELGSNRRNLVTKGNALSQLRCT